MKKECFNKILFNFNFRVPHAPPHSPRHVVDTPAPLQQQLHRRRPRNSDKTHLGTPLYQYQYPLPVPRRALPPPTVSRLSRNPRRVAAREGTRDRPTAACSRLLVQVGQLKRVVAFGEHDLLEDGLVGRPDPAKGVRVLLVERSLHLDDELVDRVERSPVLEGLDRVKKPRSRVLVSGCSQAGGGT